MAYTAKHYKTKACKTCQLKPKCTSSKTNRYIERSEFQEYIEENNKRVYKKPDYYRQRQQIIEHQFGTLKRHWHFDYTLTRSKEKVLGEVYLAFTVYNLKRALSVLGFEGIMSRIEAHLLSVKAVIHQFKEEFSLFKRSKLNYAFLLLKI